MRQHAFNLRRRGTVMVFILGILALLGLLGLALVSKTHTEAARVTIQSSASADTAVIDGVLRSVRERLRVDIWGDPPLGGLSFTDRPLTEDARPGSASNPFSLRENNEPFDKPGESDRWLGSLMPYVIGTVTVNGSVLEPDVLAWDHVSYIGSDILLPPSSSPFMWAINARTGAPGLIQYGPTALDDIQMIQTPPPGMVANFIPGSTTNRTMRQALIAWRQGDLPLILAGTVPGPPNVRPQFPYFDTNADGVVDLYDADGDGIPDSPLSIVIQLDSDDPNKPRQLYAAVRIVDHNAMGNVNVGASMMLPNGSLTFDETLPGLQRRGRRTSEFLLDAIIHPDDWLDAPRSANLAQYRIGGGTQDPVALDSDVVRRTLIGGAPNPSLAYNLYEREDEASLRHRFMLVPYHRKNDEAVAYANNDYRTIDRALPGTAFWSRQLAPNLNSQALSYAQPQTDPARWSRINSNYISPNFEGYANGPLMGARRFLDENETFAVKRPMLTTTSVDVQMPPLITRGAINVGSVVPGPNDTPIDFRMRQFWQLGMNWPVLIGDTTDIAIDPTRPPVATLTDIPTEDLPAEWLRPQPIDINMGSTTDLVGAKFDLIRYTAAAIYLALNELNCPQNGVGPNYQGVPLCDSLVQGASLNREYLAWQFAVNLADYRDSDGAPTTIEWPGLPGNYISGIEKQPFFTEAYASLAPEPPVQPNNLPPSSVGNKWFFGFELYVPPGWRIPASQLYFRAPDASPDLGLIPLSGFRQVAANGLGVALGNASLDGGPALAGNVVDGDHGNYYVFCGRLDFATPQVRNGLNNQRTYANPAFSIATNGRGRLELVYSPDGDPTNAANHVIDVIAPEYSGGSLAGGTTSGDGAWAYLAPGLSDQVMHEFSLRRSTKGWRFTTAWHMYGQKQTPGANNPPPSVFNVSLGLPNVLLDDLNDNIPESIWPTVTSLATLDGEMPNGFVSGRPFEAFDSVADLSRLFMIGPAHLENQTVPILFDTTDPARPVLADDLPATAFLAHALNWPAPGDLPQRSADRVAAGRVDFVDATRVGGNPWTWRLFEYFTAHSLLHDNIDNDGNGAADFADPTEAARMLFRIAGRQNLNTAPVTALRGQPYMANLPNSVEYIFHNGLPGGGYFAEYGNTPGLFWDFASAIVAKREDRAVPVRLPDNNNLPTTIAVAQHSGGLGGLGGGSGGGGSGGSGGSSTGPFESVADLVRLTDVQDQLGGNNELFRTDRFGVGGFTPMTQHRVRADEPVLGPLASGIEQALSPDYRYKRDAVTTDYIPIEAPIGFPGDPNAVTSDPMDAGGIRGRDIFLTRLANTCSTRSDVFTAYIAIIDENGNYVQRSQVTLDRSVCFGEIPGPGASRVPVLPRIIVRSDGGYADDTK